MTSLKVIGSVLSVTGLVLTLALLVSAWWGLL